MAISVKNLNFFYGSSQALFDINLDAQEGDTVVLLGPSGAGKSTLIRTLNLLEVIFWNRPFVAEKTGVKTEELKVSG